jgi:putative phosphoesterase
MKRIGLISDTHDYLGADVCSYLSDVDEIWHAGDIGSLAVLDKIREMKPCRVVYGNIDGATLRNETQVLECCKLIPMLSTSLRKLVMWLTNTLKRSTML